MPGTSGPVPAITAGQQGVRAVTADGEVVFLRPLVPDDRDAVLRLHEGLDERDRYYRFFGPVPGRLVDLVLNMISPVGARRGSIGAFRGSELIGVGHYDGLAEPTEAEVALAVAHSAQAHGVGTLLLEYLVSIARAHGVRRFVAEVLTENRRMMRLLTDSGLPCHLNREGPVTHVELVLDEVEPYLNAMSERERLADKASLRVLLRPQSVAVIGAGRSEGSVGHAVLANILRGGYAGQLYAVNPRAVGDPGILGVPTVASAEDLPVACDVAVLCVPARAVPDVAEQCGRRGVRALVVITAGITGVPELRDGLREAVRRHGMRVLGPNCVGLANTDPTVRLDATFAPPPAAPGSIGLVTQSGGLGIALRERLRNLGLGLSTMVSTGDKYDVSGNDMLMWWLGDASAVTILYLESFGNPRKFSRLCRALTRVKPVLAVRAGSTKGAQRAAASHTAATATPAVTRDALFGQAGVIAVNTTDELIATVAALSWQPRPAGNRVAVVTNVGGIGVLAADAAVSAGLVLADLAPETIEALRVAMPSTATAANPTDTTAAVDPETYNRCVAAVLADPGVDAVIAASVPTAVGDPITQLHKVIGRAGDKPVLVVRSDQVEAVAPLPGPDGSPMTASYSDPATPIGALGRLAGYARWRDRENPPAVLPADADVPAALALLREAFRAHPEGGWLDPDQTDALLRCFGIPLVGSRTCAPTDEDALRAFDEFGGGPVVIKAIAEGLLHKSAGGGVLVDVHDHDEVIAGVRQLRDRFGDTLGGLIIQPMLPHGREFLVGVNSDVTFGPLVVFGIGGVDTDVVADRSARLTPLGQTDAEDLMRGLRASASLFGPEARSPLDEAAIQDVLLRIGLLAQLLPEVVELDLNPLIAWRKDVRVVDARIRLAPVRPGDPYLPALRV
ncbi:MAG TPA: GNAT family N-acetyltransferase [Pseudonocardiaceae bacterium]